MILISKVAPILILISCTIRISAQEIKITEFRSDPMDISARENAVFDANGDPCSLIKARCGLEDIFFEADLGIQKIDRKEGESWIWVPPGTNRLTIYMNDSISYNFDLPQLTEEYRVYVIVVSVILPVAIEYKDIPKLSLISNPIGAKIYLNEVFYGNTPIYVNYNFDSLKIRVEKKTYETIYRDAVNTEKNQEFTFNLKKDPLATRFFITITIDPKNYEIFNPGITFGMLGKTGFYFSLRPGIIQPNYSGTSRAQYSDTSAYYLSSFIESRDILRKFEIFGGITKKVFKNVFISFGVGYWEYHKYQKLTFNSTLQQNLGNKYRILRIDPYGIPRFAGVTFDTHLYCRMWNKMLLNFQTSFFRYEDIIFESSDWGTWETTLSGSLHADIKIGLGYSF